VALPERIKISYDKWRKTNLVGTCAGGRQFMAFVVATLPAPLPRDRRAHQHWHAVLHTFDEAGHHLRTRAWFAGKTADGERDAIARARAKLTELMLPLGEVTLGEVFIRLFSVEIGGATFGLVDVSDPVEESEAVALVPNGLWFTDPWDGRYDGVD
jgi:hypothetical protein